MTRDFNKILSFYKKKLNGRPIGEIKDVALSAWKNVKIDKMNRELGLIQEEMARQEMKHDTFKWIYNTDKALIRLNKKYKLNVKTIPIKYLIGNEKPKIILFIIVSKIINKIIAIHNCMNDAMVEMGTIENKIK